MYKSIVQVLIGKALMAIFAKFSFLSCFIWREKSTVLFWVMFALMQLSTPDSKVYLLVIC